MKNKIEKPKSLNELKKEKGRTNWSRLILEDKQESNKVIQPTQKTRD